MRYLEPKTLRRLLATSAVVLAAFTAACGDDDDDDGNGTGPDDETAIQVTNGSGIEAWFIFFRECGTEDFGDDRLGSDDILSPGESFTSEVTAGCYDVLATSEPGAAQEFEALYEDQEVEEGETHAITIEDDDWQAVPAAARARPGVGRK